MHWAVSQSLLLALSHHPITDVAPQPDLGFIYRPLREFFRHRDRNLAKTLKQLAVLEARFQRLYLREEEIDQTYLFDTSTDFFDRATTTPPQELAQFLTDCDIAAFRSLDPQSIISEGSYLRHMHRRWDRLCRAAQEIVAVESRLGPLLADLAEASLWTLHSSQFADTRIRNYVSNGTSTVCALYFKLYEKPASMNLNCHTSLFSSISTGITSLTGKRTKWHRVFRFCLLILGNSDMIQRKRYRKFILLYRTRTRKSQCRPRALKSGSFPSMGSSVHGVLGSGSR